MKLFLKGERCYTEKCAIEKRNFAPGQYGKTRKAKLVGYGHRWRKFKAKLEPTPDRAVEHDGPGIPEADRGALFARGARLDTTGKPGTGLGLAIVRDVAEIYGGAIHLEESEDLGGLLARLTLPAG